MGENKKGQPITWLDLFDFADSEIIRNASEDIKNLHKSYQQLKASGYPEFAKSRELKITPEQITELQTTGYIALSGHKLVVVNGDIETI